MEINQKSLESERCYRCLKRYRDMSVPAFYEFVDTASGEKIKICVSCGEELKKWLFVNEDLKKENDSLKEKLAIEELDNKISQS